MSQRKPPGRMVRVPGGGLLEYEPGDGRPFVSLMLDEQRLVVEAYNAESVAGLRDTTKKIEAEAGRVAQLATKEERQEALAAIEAAHAPDIGPRYRRVVELRARELFCTIKAKAST